MLSRKRRSVRARHRRGAVLVLVAVLLVALMGVAALSIDAGNMYQERRKTQIAADAAADAAAVELYTKFEENAGEDVDGQAKASALALAAAHGYGVSGSTSTVTVNIPPQSGAFANQAGYVEVVINSPMSRGFSAVLGKGDLNVSTRSVAAGTMINTSASVLVLNPTRKDTLKLKGKTTSLEVAGDIVVNSTNKSAVKVDKKAQIKAENVLVAGKIDRKSKGLIDADVSTGVVPTPDPWSSLPKPAKGAELKAKDFKSGSGDNETYDLVPGTYKELKFDKHDVVNMAPGVYYVDGGGFQLKEYASLQAQGVTIYNSGKKGFKFETKGSVSISPPTSGTYKDITLFQDRTSKTKVEFKKQSHIDMSGVIYAPNSEVKFRKSDVAMGGDDDDDDWDLEGEDEGTSDESGEVEMSSIGASIVAAKLSLDQKSHVRLDGADISAKRPLLGIVE
jgi:Flp pilus assembly protein TadG